MITHMSRELALVYNLLNTANWHRNNCHNECDVSLHQLMEVARIIMQHLNATERQEAEDLLKKWPR